MQEATNAPHPRFGPRRWMSSLFGKITLFLLAGVFVAYVVGSGVGWLVMEQGQRRQWAEQAELNAQIASSAIRNIYTFVAVDVSASGQITRILTERPIGDDQSVLDTGFVPADVLALAGAQTKQKVWLFGWSEANGFRSISDGEGRESDLPLAFSGEAKDRAGSSGILRVGFMRIGAQEYFASFLPIVTHDGQLLGAVVASVGSTGDLLAARTRMLGSTTLLLVVVMMGTGLLITLLMRSLFRPVPVLIDALAALARNETDRSIPYQKRRDEIGRLAVAVETLRAAVVEREALREVREKAAEMEHLAHHDTLTGLPNRALFQKALSDALADVSARDGALNLILFDLDRFKPVNDTFGHAAGDKVLITICERIRALLGPSDLVARLGGDEFAVIQRTEPAAAEWEARRLAAAMIEVATLPCEFDGLSVTVGVSAGIATAPRDGTAEGDLIRAADIALYAAKDGGRGRYQIYEPGMSMRPAAGTRERNELLQALLRGEFVLHYQPVVRLADGGLWGYEALVRWNHPRRGLLLPEEFVAMAEASGAILPLGRWAMRKACEDALGFEPGSVVSVNLSAVQVTLDNVAVMVEEALRQSGLPAKRLEIELTENRPLVPAEAHAAFEALLALGVRIALDDFGTGQANLSALAALPFTRIKIDRRFIASLMTSHVSRSIVGGILGIARELGLAVTAEGVETVDQAELLRQAGCETAQGYLFGRPAPALQWQAQTERACG